MPHSFFGFKPLGDFWDVVGATGVSADDRRGALYALAMHLDELPGAVFFEVPEGALEDEHWQRIVAISQPYCDCQPRRVLVPKNGRSRFMPNDPPQLVELTVAEGAGNYNSPPLVIAPHGGDAASAYVSWQFNYNKLVSREAPLRQNPPRDKPMLYGHRYASDFHPGIMSYDMSSLNVLVERHGEVMCSQTVGSVLVPVCSIVKVVQTHDSNWAPTVTIELDASVVRVDVDPNAMPELHVCTRDA